MFCGILWASFWEPRAGLGRSWGRLGAGKRTKRRNDPSFKAVQAAPSGLLRRLWATFDSLFDAKGRPLDNIFIVFRMIHSFWEQFYNMFRVIWLWKYLKYIKYTKYTKYTIYTKYTKYIRYKNLKITKFTKYKLWNLYKIQNKKVDV